jgi:hypothetical protein
MHVNSLCACSHSEAMKGSSSLRLLILSGLLASPVWAQLTLTDPTWGARPLYLQNGNPSHRVRGHSLTRVQNNADPSLDLYVAYCLAQTSFITTVNSSLVLVGGRYKKKPGRRFLDVKG